MTNLDKVKTYDIDKMATILTKAALIGAKDLCLIRGLPVNYYLDSKTESMLVTDLFPKIRKSLMKEAEEIE